MNHEIVEENLISLDKVKLVDEDVANLLHDHFLEDGSIIGYFEDESTFSKLTAVLRSYGYSFSIRDSSQIKRDDKKNTIFYYLKAMPIRFFGLPFTVEKTIHYHCIHGRKYYKTKSEKSRKESRSIPSERIKLGSSKKMGCLATMTLKKIIFYPDFFLDDKNKWRIKRTLIENLRSQLNQKETEVTKSVRFYVSISIKDRHNHPPLERALKCERSPGKFERIPSEIEGGSIVVEESDEAQVFQTLVSFPNEKSWEDVKPEEQMVASASNNEEEVVASYQIEMQYTSLEDLQTLFKEKLKRLYLLGENCQNPAVLIKLVTEFEQADNELVAAIGHDPTI